MENRFQPIRVAILASGNGTNAENIMQRCANDPESIAVAVVISDQRGAGVLERARRFGALSLVIARETTKEEHERRIVHALEGRQVDWIFLAGYMRILSPSFVRKFQSRIVNIHPSLLPQFPGRDSYARAFEAKVPVSGVTLHLVDEGVDTGKIIAQAPFERLPDDTLDTFRERGLRLEYQLYRDFIDQLVRSPVKCQPPSE